MDATEELLGREVIRVRRLLYVLPDGGIQGDRGDLELTDMVGRVVVLGVGADGEQVGCHAGPWQDPFDVPLSDANADFVRRSGKWVAFDLTEVPPYAQLVGRITSVQPMKRGEKVFGVTLINDVGSKVEVTCDADETWVRFSPG